MLLNLIRNILKQVKIMQDIKFKKTKKPAVASFDLLVPCWYMSKGKVMNRVEFVKSGISERTNRM